MISELASARDSSAGLERDNSELSARVSELEKARANLDSELKSAHSRLATAVSTSSGLDTNSIFYQPRSGMVKWYLREWTDRQTDRVN